uniref:Uncharacterized protein n=1 Tax=Meloidogyne enterolobii TaxID=390850 RepID=A0A6V7YDL1_MELEN|nr:unnamed protein product [Meloidogyne enterolobii]
MPVFEKLTLSDQIAHLSRIWQLFRTFTNTYLAWELGSETWTRKDNIMPALSFMKNPVFLNDDEIIKSSDYVFTKSVAHFKRASLTKVEFALLIAVPKSPFGWTHNLYGLRLWEGRTLIKGGQRTQKFS